MIEHVTDTAIFRILIVDLSEFNGQIPIKMNLLWIDCKISILTGFSDRGILYINVKCEYGECKFLTDSEKAVSAPFYFEPIFVLQIYNVTSFVDLRNLLELRN